MCGSLLFLAFAFRVTHPDWRKQRKRYKRWKKNAKERTMYPFARKMTFSRTVLKATDESQIWDYYVMKLGFRMKGQIVPENEEGTVFLLEMGNYQLEIECSNKTEKLGEQKLIISVTKPDKVRERLEKNGIHVSPYETDPFTGMNSFHFNAPDGVSIIMLAQNE